MRCRQPSQLQRSINKEQRTINQMKQFLFFILSLCTIVACKTISNQKAPTTVAQKPQTMCAPRAIDPLAEFDGPAPIFEGLGDYAFPITTKSKEAQQYFEQGFKLANGFNHAEAARSFKYAIKLDEECAMCHWGLAYVLGPNYNAGMEPAVVEVASQSVKKALKYMANTRPREQLLIKIMAKRYPEKVVEDRSAFDQAYSDALQTAHQQFPKDDDIAALYAESIMDMHPWDLWEKDGQPKAWTPEILEILENILNRNPKHVASIHLYIHATEASFTPNKALTAARRLAALAPGAGHLVHMPSHTYIRTGNYHEGVVTNQKAVIVDSLYVQACHAAGMYPLFLYPHNYHFLTACAAFEGSSNIALKSAAIMMDALDTKIMREPGYETIQHFWSIPYYLQVKFAKWDEILSEPQPDQDLIYPRAIWHYARGMAYQAKGKMSLAQKELVSLNTLKKDEALEGVSIFGINMMTDLLDIATNVLEGEMAASQGNWNLAIEKLKAGVAIEDRLNYNEPPDWFFSVRHHLGAVLLNAEKFAEAEAVYKKDLELFPETGWALKGLYTSYKKQNKQKEAAKAKARFDKAWQYADVKLQGSKVI